MTAYENYRSVRLCLGSRSIHCTSSFHGGYRRVARRPVDCQVVKFLFFFAKRNIPWSVCTNVRRCPSLCQMARDRRQLPSDRCRTSGAELRIEWRARQVMSLSRRATGSSAAARATSGLRHRLYRAKNKVQCLARAAIATRGPSSSRPIKICHRRITVTRWDGATRLGRRQTRWTTCSWLLVVCAVNLRK